MRWTEADLSAARARLQGYDERQRMVKRSKYRNQKTHFAGQVFDSKAECEQWRSFEYQRISGQIRSVVRQVSLPLLGSARRHRIDFLVIENDGTHRWYDTKGMDTAMGKLKRQQVFDAYGITIELL